MLILINSKRKGIKEIYLVKFKKNKLMIKTMSMRNRKLSLLSKVEGKKIIGLI